MFIRPFSTLRSTDVCIAGGKGASLGEMTQAGIPVPPGFVLVSDAFDAFLEHNELKAEIETILSQVKHEEVRSIESASERIQSMIRNGEIPEGIKIEIQQALHLSLALSGQERELIQLYAVRSSATAEDGADHAWAGQLDTYLNVSPSGIPDKVRDCWASLFTPRAIFYRTEKKLHDMHISVAVVVQSMIQSESAGVAFSVHPVTENQDEIVIEGSYGLGEAVVSGEVTPDSFVVSKKGNTILSRHISTKSRGIFKNESGENQWLTIPEPKASTPIFTDERILELAQMVIHIENHYGFPCDIEWAFADDEFYILQARPITTLKKALPTHPFPNGVVKMGRWALPLLSSECWNSEITQQRFFDKLVIWREFIVLHEIYPDFQNPYYSKDFFDNLKTRLQELYAQDNKALFNRAITFYDEDVEAKKEIDKLTDIGLSKQSNEELAAIFLENRRLTASMTVYDQMGWLCENYLYEGITHILEKKGLKKGSHEFNKYQFSLTQPSHISTTLKEKKAVLESSQRIRSGISTVEKESENLSKEFGYMPVFAYGAAWESSYYREQLQDILSTDCDVQEEVAQLANYSSIQKKDFSEAVRDLDLTLEEQQRFIDFGLILDTRNEAEYFVSYAGKHLVKILDEASKRLGIPTGKLLNLQKSEIVSLLNGDDSRENILSRRKKIAGWGYLNGSTLRTVFDGEEAENIFEAFENEKVFIQGNTEEKGVCGSPGKTQGKIRIVRNPGENSKVQTGDILVTYATTVDYLPAMKKAGAIITEVGGITCHAAVVSREFRIPCVIAFKNAMEYFSDGDLVEVDADNGIVKILARYSDSLEAINPVDYEYLWSNHNINYIFNSNYLTSSILREADIVLLYDAKERELKYFLGKKDRERIENWALDIYQHHFSEWREKIQQHILKGRELIQETLGSSSDIIHFSDEQITKAIQKRKEIFSSLVDDYFCTEFFATSKAESFAASDSESGLAKNLHEMSHIKFEAREVLTQFYNYNTVFKPYLDIVAERYNRADIEWLDINEVIALLQGEKIPSSHRSEANWLRANKLDWEFISSDEANRAMQKFDKHFFSISGDTLRGVTANKGTVTGKARILKTVFGDEVHHEIAKVQKGDILIAATTGPELMLACKRAGAIITDEGGLTSHAAIVSREIGIPCIVGTKIATRFFTDGDMIEVDADNGIAKILPKEQNKLATLYQTQISLTEWFQNIGHKDADILRMEDNEKRERLKILGKTIGLPFDKPTKFAPRDIIERSPEFKLYLAEHGHEKCALRLIPSEPGLPKLRMRGQTVADVVKDWFPKQDTDPEKYRAEFIPHPEKNEWATIFIVNEKGIFGEIIADGHHHLTQGFYDEKKPIMFCYDFKTWTTFPKNIDAEIYLTEMIECIHVKDAGQQDVLKKSLGAKFSHEYVMGYFETTHSEFGTWFIDYSPVLGDLYGDYSPSLPVQKNTGDVSGISGYPGKVQGKVRIVSDPRGVTLQPDEILVCDMTSPDFVQLMQQTRGIITDRGGLLSHAGIIARELRKPTILATGNATQVLKDGDMIEMDPDIGIVKIL